MSALPAVNPAASEHELLDGRRTLTAEAESVPGASFRSAGGRELKVVCGFEMIVSVQDGSEVGVRVTPTVIDTHKGRVLRGRVRAKLDPVDFWEIDRAVLEAARPLLLNPQRPALVPISFHSISRARAREKLFEAVGLAREQTLMAMITEVVGMDAGTPQGRLNDAVSIVRPFSSAVFVEALSPAVVGGLIVNGVGGVTVDFRDIRRGRKGLGEALHEFGEGGRDAVRTLIARGLPSAEYFEAAAAAGVTHASLRGQAAAGAEAEANAEPA